MKKLFPLLLFLLPGCGLLSGGLDKAGDQLRQQLTDYCAQPLYRREALYILVNGALEPQSIQVSVVCPGDDIGT